MSSRFARPESSCGLSFHEWLRNYASKLDNDTLEPKDKEAIHRLHTFYNLKRTKISVNYVFFVPFMIFEHFVRSSIIMKDLNEHKEVSSDSTANINWNIEYVLEHLKQRRALKKELYFTLENNIKYLRSRRDLVLKPFSKLRSMQSIDFLNLSVKVVQSLNILRLCMWDNTDLLARAGSLSDAKDYYCTTFTEDALRESCDSDGAYKEPCAFYVETQNRLCNLSQKVTNERQEKIFTFLRKKILCKFSSNLEYYGLLRGAKVQSLVQRLLDCGSVDVDILCNCKEKMFNHAGLQAYLVRKMDLALEQSCKTSSSRNRQCKQSKNSKFSDTAPRIVFNRNPGDKTK